MVPSHVPHVDPAHNAIQRALERSTSPRLYLRSVETPDPETRRYGVSRTASHHEAIGRVDTNVRDTPTRMGSNGRFSQKRTPQPGRRSPLSNSMISWRTRKTLPLADISGVSTVATDPARVAFPSGKEFVPTVHLSLDAFPQFPSSNQVPSTPVISTNSKQAPVYQSLVPRTPDSNEAVTLSDVLNMIALLIRAILYEYKTLWFTLAILLYGSRWIYCMSKILILPAIAIYLWPQLCQTAKEFLFLRPVTEQIYPVQQPPITEVPKRIRDLPEHQPIEIPLATDRISKIQPVVQVPPWLRWTPIGRFGEPDDVELSFQLGKTMPLGFTQKSVKIRGSDDVIDVSAMQSMIRKLKNATSYVCNRLVLTEKQDNILASALSQFGLRYVVEHPLAAFYSLDLNDSSVVNLNDRHFPSTLINLSNSPQPNERQIASELIQLIIQRRQEEKLLMVPGDQRLPLLRRLAKWSYGALDKEYSVYYTALPNLPMTDGDILHHILFTWIAQQLPLLRTDIFSRTYLSTPSDSHAQRASFPAISIQKLPTDMPSAPGTLYRITELILPSTKSKTKEISWDGQGVLEGISFFLLRLESLRPDIISQASTELTRLLET